MQSPVFTGQDGQMVKVSRAAFIPGSSSYRNNQVYYVCKLKTVGVCGQFVVHAQSFKPWSFFLEEAYGCLQCSASLTLDTISICSAAKGCITSLSREATLAANEALKLRALTTELKH